MLVYGLFMLTDATAATDKIRCDACPVMCYIKPGTAGACDRYANHNGELVRFENDGYLYHMIIALPAKTKAGAKALDAALLAGDQRKANKLVSGPPLQLMGTVGRGGMHQQVLKAKPGFYVLACFMNTQDGRVHTQLGMERVIRIVK